MISRVAQPGDEDGFAMVFVLFVTTIVMIGVATALTLVAPNIITARSSQDTSAALAAARSGIDDVVAYLVSIPSCRSESRICPDALGASSQALQGTARQRPALGTDQSFSWTTGAAATADGYVRVTATGRSRGAARTIIADLSLRPSILGYGYYTDYEALSPEFLQGFYKPRSVYLTDSTICGNTSFSCSSAAPKYANWTGPSNASVCGQHWYAEPGRAGRYAAGDSPIKEAGKVGTSTSTTSGTTVNRTGGCDLVFSSSMVQNGKTFTRDAILSSGNGPTFNQPAYTMWGYDDGVKRNTTPAFDSAGKYYRGDTMKNGSIRPQVAADDLILPTTIGKDGIPENACVFSGPTRVKLNGDGTATVTSPTTRTKNAASDPGCYPANVSGGVIGWRYKYGSTGGGALVARNAGSVPSGGWPTNPTKATQTPSSTDEVFYFDAPGSTDVPQHTDVSAAPYSGCSGTTKYSATVSAACTWTTVGAANDSTTSTGWTTYTNARCNTPPATTDRQLFECEYANDTSNTQRAVALAAGQYKTVRDNVQSDLAGATCLTGTTTTQAGCINTVVANRIKVANTGGTVAGTATDGAHRYVATSTVGTSVDTTVNGTTGTGPDGTTTDTFFTQPVPATEKLTRTPITTSIKRQVYSSSSKAWGSSTAAFTLTTTQSNYTYTAARGMTYFPKEQDVTGYNIGTDSTGAAPRGTGVTPQSGDRQPGDLYIDGRNKGKLSVLADDDVVITGDITNPSGYTPATDAVSITAGVDVRNYHPVGCVDQTAADINNTSTGWCPNDITGLSSSSLISGGAYTSANPAEQYTNMVTPADRTIQAAVFALSGSFGTDNYNRADAVGDLNINGGLYQSHRGGNGVVSGSTELSGTTLQYTYVDLQRAELPYVPPSTSGNDVRPWNVVSLSAGTNPDPKP